MANFSDIKDHWAKDCIEELADRNILSGYKDGTFKPDAPVTRAEFAAMLVSAFPDRTKIREGQTFKDVSATFWADRAIDFAYRTGFLSGYPGAIFKPEEKIPRVQALVALANGLKYVPSLPAKDTLSETFSDTQEIPDYAATAIAAATEKGLVVNYPDVKQLKPNQSATRAEVAAFLSQALLKAGVESSVPPQYIAQLKVVPPPNRQGELRGVWLTSTDSEVLYAADRLTTAIATLAELKINTLYPTLWNGRYTLYPSEVMKRVTGIAQDPTAGLKDRDVLAELVEKTHQKGLAVIPNFQFGLTVKADSELAANRPNWLTKRQDGSVVVEGPRRQDDKFWLNPFHPQVQQFILNLVAEMVGKYQVDGIQFNEDFGLAAEFGYDALTVRLYQQEHNGQNPPTNSQDPNWVSWRAQKMTDLMMRVFWVAKEYNPKCLISLAAKPYPEAYANLLQDWSSWEKFGYVEELVLQNYQTDLAKFTAELNKPEVQTALRHLPVSVGISLGSKDLPIPAGQLKDQVKEVRDRKFNGVSFFYYESLVKLATDPQAGKDAYAATFKETSERPKSVTA